MPASRLSIDKIRAELGWVNDTPDRTSAVAATFDAANKVDTGQEHVPVLSQRVEIAVLDGEIACVDDAGRPVFRDLLFRRRQCVFIAFDLPYLNGKDLRTLPLIERKSILKKLLRRKRSRILYV